MASTGYENFTRFWLVCVGRCRRHRHCRTNLALVLTIHSPFFSSLAYLKRQADDKTILATLISGSPKNSCSITDVCCSIFASLMLIVHSLILSLCHGVIRWHKHICIRELFSIKIKNVPRESNRCVWKGENKMKTNTKTVLHTHPTK